MKRIFIFWLFINCMFADAQTPPAYVPTSSLSGWYSFSGNANDVSGNGNHGNVVGATLTSDANSVASSAYMFTPNSKIVTPIRPQSTPINIPVLGSAALFTWFNATSLGTTLGPNSADGLGHCLISSDSAGHGGKAVGVVSGSLTGNIGVTWFRKAFQFVPGIWYHVGLNFDAATQVAELFVNGASIGTVNVQPPFQNVSPGLYTLGYVSNPFTWNVPYNGKMDEVGIWKRALSKCEITQLYNKNVFALSSQPQSQYINGNNTVNFIISSNFNNTAYQWQVNTGSGFVNLTNNSQYGGTNSATLSINNAGSLNTNNVYRCVLTSGICSIESNTATIKHITSISAVDPKNGFDYLYPNPTGGVFNLLNSGKSQITIFNMLGKSVYQICSEEDELRIDFSEMPNGLYFIKQQKGSSINVYKLILEH